MAPGSKPPSLTPMEQSRSGLIRQSNNAFPLDYNLFVSSADRLLRRASGRHLRAREEVRLRVRGTVWPNVLLHPAQEASLVRRPAMVGAARMHPGVPMPRPFGVA